MAAEAMFAGRWRCEREGRGQHLPMIRFARNISLGNRSGGTRSLPNARTTMYRAHAELSVRQYACLMYSDEMGMFAILSLKKGH